MESDFSGKLLIKILKKYTVWILVCAILAGGIAFAYTCTIKPVYSTTASFYVTNIQDKADFTQTALVAAAQSLAKGYLEIIKSDRLMVKVSEDLNAQYGYELSSGELRSMVGGKVEDESEVFTVSVSHTDPVLVDRVLRSIEKNAPAVIDSTVKRTDCVVLLTGVSTARPVETEGEKPLASKVSPNQFSNTLIGSVVGLIVSFAFFAFVTVSDRTIRSEDDLKNRYDVPVLGSVPRWIDRDGGNA